MNIVGSKTLKKTCKEVYFSNFAGLHSVLKFIKNNLEKSQFGNFAGLEHATLQRSNLLHGYFYRV